MTWIWQHDNWPHFEYDPKATYSIGMDEFQLKSQRLYGRIEAMSATDQIDTVVELMLSEVIKTNMIEGESLDRDSVRSSLLALLSADSSVTAPPDQKAAAAAEFMVDVRNHWEHPLDQALLARWQSRIIVGQRTSVVMHGAYRNDSASMQIVSGPIGHYRVHYEAPPAAQVPAEMARFFDWYNASHPTDGDCPLPGLIRAGIAHVWFEMLHPFDDGNGRVGRAIADHALSQSLGYPTLTCLASAVERNRQSYYRELERVGRGDLNLDAWLGFFAEAVRQAHDITQQQVDFVLRKARFYDAFGEQMNTRQKKIVARVFAEGTKGFAGGLTTRKYQAITKCSRATAFRDLADMLKQGMLVPRPGAGRNVSYDLAPVSTSLFHALIPS